MLMRLRYFSFRATAALVLAVGLPVAATVAAQPATGGPVNFQIDGWTDNWFAAYNGEKLIVEDSVPITTVMSFNSESARFTAEYPLHLNFIIKDYLENKTGLEYIGTRRQQMGDGGFIMQVTDLSTGKVVAVSDEKFACKVIMRAPLDKSCEREARPVAGVAPCTFMELAEPAGWKRPDFDDSSWKDTTVWGSREVSPKDGYYRIKWDRQAKFIWGPDILADNTVLCRVTVNKPAN